MTFFSIIFIILITWILLAYVTYAKEKKETYEKIANKVRRDLLKRIPEAYIKCIVKTRKDKITLYVVDEGLSDLFHKYGLDALKYSYKYTTLKDKVMTYKLLYNKPNLEIVIVDHSIILKEINSEKDFEDLIILAIK